MDFRIFSFVPLSAAPAIIDAHSTSDVDIMVRFFSSVWFQFLLPAALAHCRCFSTFSFLTPQVSEWKIISNHPRVHYDGHLLEDVLDFGIRQGRDVVLRGSLILDGASFLVEDSYLESVP